MKKKILISRIVLMSNLYIVILIVGIKPNILNIHSNKKLLTTFPFLINVLLGMFFVSGIHIPKKDTQ